jgi:hypothetical protein
VLAEDAVKAAIKDFIQKNPQLAASKTSIDLDIAQTKP